MYPGRGQDALSYTDVGVVLEGSGGAVRCCEMDVSGECRVMSVWLGDASVCLECR